VIRETRGEEWGRGEGGGGVSYSSYFLAPFSSLNFSVDKWNPGVFFSPPEIFTLVLGELREGSDTNLYNIYISYISKAEPLIQGPSYS
jgi:hypothetical protein